MVQGEEFDGCTSCAELTLLFHLVIQRQITEKKMIIYQVGWLCLLAFSQKQFQIAVLLIKRKQVLLV